MTEDLVILVAYVSFMLLALVTLTGVAYLGARLRCAMVGHDPSYLGTCMRCETPL